MANSTVPVWITKDFFQCCIQAHESQAIAIKDYTIDPLDLPEGSNYGSQILRAKVDCIKEDKNYSISLIVKVPVANVEQIMGEIYEKEVKFYTEFVSETYKYCKHDLVPGFYISPNPQCVVLEDLNISGYKMVDRKKFLDLEHCQLFIKAKAKLHALSFVIYKNNPEIIKSLVKESPTHQENIKRFTKLMIDGGLQCMIAHFEDSQYTGKYLDIMKEASKNDSLWEMYQEMERCSSSKQIKVLVQLDPWCTNMMFKYDNLGRVTNVKLLDFQSLAFTSPLKEIVTFMAMCPNIEVRKTKINYLYHLYYTTFNNTLAELGCSERLNFDEMTAEITDMSPLVLFLICAVVPILLSEGAADVNEYFSGSILQAPIRESSTFKSYQSPIFYNLMPLFLDAIESEGVFDYVKEKMKLQ